MLGFLQLSLKSISACLVVFASGVCSNLQLIATVAASGVTKLLTVLRLEPGPPGHHWVSDRLSIDVLDWVIPKSDSDRCRPRVFQPILSVRDLHHIDACKVVCLIIGQTPDCGTGEYTR